MQKVTVLLEGECASHKPSSATEPSIVAQNGVRDHERFYQSVRAPATDTVTAANTWNTVTAFPAAPLGAGAVVPGGVGVPGGAAVALITTFCPAEQ